MKFLLMRFLTVRFDSALVVVGACPLRLGPIRAPSKLFELFSTVTATMNGPYSKSSGSGPLAAQAQAAVARKPTALERMVSRVTLLTLQEKYHDNCHVLRVRGFAAMGLLALGAIAAAGTLAWLSWALPVLPAMLLALWLAAEIWFYVCNFIPRWAGGIVAPLHVH